eukprot:Mycagemm_TRINITY_DN10298_c1_g4::TRINITY_DN10298_c1_g4_i1::g.4224::m.4224 type:complete len:109 gc:universal TRINITY_DN10298_c1_g4_i1:1679-2005(+)
MAGPSSSPTRAASTISTPTTGRPLGTCPSPRPASHRCLLTLRRSLPCAVVSSRTTWAWGRPWRCSLSFSQTLSPLLPPPPPPPPPQPLLTTRPPRRRPLSTQSPRRAR